MKIWIRIIIKKGDERLRRIIFAILGKDDIENL